MMPPAAKPLASAADRPVAVMEGAWDWNRSFRPKNCEKPAPPREDGRGGVILHQDAIAAGGGDGKLAIGEAGAAIGAQRACSARW